MYLIDKHNIAMGRIAIRTFGKDAPIASNDEEAGRAKNRRVTIDVLGFAE
jgi:outer membrane protein OmpA-like peptidoglycan-associated protein